MKKTYLFLLTMLMSMVSNIALAYDITVANDEGVTLYYNYINDKKELSVASVDKSAVIVRIPQSVDVDGISLPVTDIAGSAFYQSNVVILDIPEGIKTIGSSAFSQCTQLNSVNIPDSFEGIIPYLCFYHCLKLSSVSLGKNVTGIGKEAFHNCSKLEKVVFPDKVAFIDNYAFQDCTNLNTVSFGSGITKIGTVELQSPFDGCSSLKKVIIRDLYAWCNVNFLGHNVAYGRNIYSDEETPIIDLIIPDNITTINDNVFYGAKGIETITIPNSVQIIGKNAFGSSHDVKKITLGKSVHEIASGAMHNGSTGKLDTVICYSVTPPNMGESNTTSIYPRTGTLFVPRESLLSYKKAEEWGEFKQILALPSVELDKHEITIKAGETYQLNASIFSSYGDSPLQWQSNNNDIITVDNNGLIKANKAGKAEISAILKTFVDAIDICKVTVIQPVEGIKLNNTRLDMNIGAMEQLIATVLPEDASNKTIKWFSSNTNICTVSNSGIVVAVGQGTSVVTATTEDGEYVAACVIIVSDGILRYDLNGDGKVSTADIQVIINEMKK